MQAICSGHFSYTWILWQSEWAKDYIFDEPKSLYSIISNVYRQPFSQAHTTEF
jgi:hypothetical protein